MILRQYFVAGTHSGTSKFWKAFGYRSLFPNHVEALKVKLLEMEAKGEYGIIVEQFHKL